MRSSRPIAWLVHFYTAIGAALALLALTAATSGDFRAAFLWLFAAMVIDCSDGTFARAARVKEVVPEFDGARLDDIIDYLTYTFVPIAIAHGGGMLPSGGGGLAVACLSLVASAYGFCRTDAKTEDHLFTGFPSYWNVVVLYFVLLQTTAAFNAAVLIALAALVFAPLRFAYPSRNPVGAVVTFTLGPAWALLILYLVLQLPATNAALAWASLLFPAWYFALSLYLTARRRAAVLDAPADT